MTLISDMKVAILAEEGVSHSDLAVSREKLEMAGVGVFIISPQKFEVKAWKADNWGNRIRIDKSLADISSDEFDGLLIPGGAFHSDNLRMNETALDLVRQFFSAGKVIATIGHGIQLLVSANVLDGRQVSAYPSLKTDVVHAGAIWMDQDVVVDNGMITCKCEDDIENFNRIFLNELREGVHQRTETII
jgi:protease I